MATSNNSTRGMFGDLDPKRDPREQVADKQIQATLPLALETAGEVLGVLSLLPQAFARAQRDELTRLERSDHDPKQSPRIDGLRASIARANTLRTTSTHGEARFARFVAALDETSQVLHGFVSDRALNALAGYRVEVSVENPNGEKPQTLAATTAEDGYFRIVLKERGLVDGTTRDRVNATFDRIIGRKVDAKNAAFKAAAAAGATATNRVGRVVVKSPRGETLYEDPVPAALDTGDVYREYVVGGTGNDSVTPPRTTPHPSSDPRAPVNPDAKAAADARTRATALTPAATRSTATVQPAPAPAAKPTPAQAEKTARPPKPMPANAAVAMPAPAPSPPAKPKAAAKAPSRTKKPHRGK